ncbi:MAG: hypothetical protein J6S14_11905 [Clostridia bacterium]|nr:hypothetical protein [Clostridia bacterium]
MTIRCWYAGRDFFGEYFHDLEAAADFSTVAEGVKLVDKCIKSCGQAGPGAVNAFRIERPDGSLLVINPEGIGAFRMIRAKNGDADRGTVYGVRELKKALRGAMVDDLQEV